MAVPSHTVHCGALTWGRRGDMREGYYDPLLSFSLWCDGGSDIKVNEADHVVVPVLFMHTQLQKQIKFKVSLGYTTIIVPKCSS